MSYDDFCRCTPEEFGAVCRCYHSEREAQLRDGWERARWQTSLLLQPYVKVKKSSRDLLPLPWDEEPSQENRAERDMELRSGEKIHGKPLSKEAQLRRMWEVASRVSALVNDGMDHDGRDSDEESGRRDDIENEEHIGGCKNGGSHKSQRHDDDSASGELHESRR